MILQIRKLIDRSTRHFDEPSEKMVYFLLVILTSWMFHYLIYLSCPESFKFDKELLHDRDPGLFDFGWFSTFASFGFYFGEIVPKSGLVRFVVLLQIVTVWYIMIS